MSLDLPERLKWKAEMWSWCIFTFRKRFETRRTKKMNLPVLYFLSNQENGLQIINFILRYWQILIKKYPYGTYIRKFTVWRIMNIQLLIIVSLGSVHLLRKGIVALARLITLVSFIKLELPFTTNLHDQGSVSFKEPLFITYLFLIFYPLDPPHILFYGFNVESNRITS